MTSMKDNIISKKKPIYPVNVALRRYLKYYGREVKSEVEYHDLLHFSNSFPIYDRKGKDTLWESVYYPSTEMKHLNKALTGLYALLKTVLAQKMLSALTLLWPSLLAAALVGESSLAKWILAPQGV